MGAVAMHQGINSLLLAAAALLSLTMRVVTIASVAAASGQFPRPRCLTDWAICNSSSMNSGNQAGSPRAGVKRMVMLKLGQSLKQACHSADL